MTLALSINFNENSTWLQRRFLVLFTNVLFAFFVTKSREYITSIMTKGLVTNAGIDR